MAPEAFRHLRDVLGRVLPVGVGGDDVGRVAYVRETCLERGAFAAVLLVYQNSVNERRGLFEHFLARRRTVVDEDDMLEALLQLRKERQQLLIRIVGRNEYRQRAV